MPLKTPLPKKNKPTTKGTTMLSFRRSKKPSLVGLDIQADNVYLLHVSQIKGKPRIENMATMALPSGTIVDGRIMKMDQLVSVIGALVHQTKTQGCAAAIALPGYCVINKAIAFPQSMTEEECEFEVYANLEKYLPGLTDEICFDFLIEKVDAVTQNMLLFAAKNDVVAGYLDSVRQAGLNVKIVDVDWCAIARAISLQEKISHQAIGILEISGQSMRIIFLHNSNMVFNQQINLDEKAADFLQQLLNYLRQSLHVFFSAFLPIDIEKFYVIGKTPLLKDIRQFLATHLDVNVDIPDPLAHLQLSQRFTDDKLKHLSAHSLVSVGLAMRAQPLW